MFSEIINPFLNVRNKIKNANGDWVDQVKPRETIYQRDENRLDISNESNHVVFEEWDKKIIIDALNYGTNSFFVAPLLWIREGETNTFTDQILHGIRGGGGRSSLIPRYIKDYGNEFLEIGQYDTENVEVVIYLKKPIILPNGGKLVFNSTSNQTGTETSYKVIWREIEE